MKSAEIGTNKSSVFSGEYKENYNDKNHPLNTKAYYYPSSEKRSLNQELNQKNVLKSNHSNSISQAVTSRYGSTEVDLIDHILSHDSIQETSGSTKYNESWPDVSSPSINTINLTIDKTIDSEMLPKEHCVDEFLATQQNSVQVKDGESTLARLVNRFRTEPPQSRVDRIGPRRSKEFWWLKSMPSNTSTPVSIEDESVTSSLETPIKFREKKRVKSDTATPSTDTERIQFRANRLLEMTESTLNSSSTVERVHEKKIPRHESLKASVKKNFNLGSSADETPLITPVNMGVKIVNRVKRPSRQQDDILYQWRLSRKLELANASNKENAFLSRRDNTELHRNTLNSGRYSEPLEVQEHRNQSYKDKADQPKVDHKPQNEITSIGNGATKVGTFISCKSQSDENKLTNRQFQGENSCIKSCNTNVTNDLNIFCEKLTEHRCKCAVNIVEPVTHNRNCVSGQDCRNDHGVISSSSVITCDFCMNNRLSLNKNVQNFINNCRCGNNHEVYHVAPGMHGICNELTCMRNKERVNVSTHVDKGSTPSKENSIKTGGVERKNEDDQKLIISNNEQTQVVRTSLKKIPTMNRKKEFSKQSSKSKLAPDHSKVSPVINQVVAGVIFKELSHNETRVGTDSICEPNEDGFEIKENGVKQVEGRVATENQELPSDDIADSSGCSEFEDDDILIELRKRRRIIKEKLK